MKTKDYEKLERKNNRLKTMVNILKKQLTVACSVIDELKTERDRKQILLSEDYRARWTDHYL